MLPAPYESHHPCAGFLRRTRAGTFHPGAGTQVTGICRAEGFRIHEVLEITESSTTDTCKKFDLIIKTIKASKEPVALIADTIDRVQRNFKELIILGDLLKEGKLQIHYPCPAFKRRSARRSSIRLQNPEQHPAMLDQ